MWNAIIYSQYLKKNWLYIMLQAWCHIIKSSGAITKVGKNSAKSVFLYIYISGVRWPSRPVMQLIIIISNIIYKINKIQVKIIVWLLSMCNCNTNVRAFPDYFHVITMKYHTRWKNTIKSWYGIYEFFWYISDEILWKLKCNF